MNIPFVSADISMVRNFDEHKRGEFGNNGNSKMAAFLSHVTTTAPK